MGRTFSLLITRLSERVAVAAGMFDGQEAFSLLQIVRLAILNCWLVEISCRNEGICIGRKLATAKVLVRESASYGYVNFCVFYVIIIASVRELRECSCLFEWLASPVLNLKWVLLLREMVS